MRGICVIVYFTYAVDIMYVHNIQMVIATICHNYRTEVEEHNLITEQPQIKYRTGSESARNRDPGEYESTVFYRTFVLLIPFYNCGNACMPF